LRRFIVIVLKTGYSEGSGDIDAAVGTGDAMKYLLGDDVEHIDRLARRGTAEALPWTVRVMAPSGRTPLQPRCA
jgi:hypothetical protein